MGEYMKMREKEKRQRAPVGVSEPGMGSTSPAQEMGDEGLFAPLRHPPAWQQEQQQQQQPTPELASPAPGSRHRPASGQEVQPSPEQMAQLTAMGFDELSARQALASAGGDVQAAADLLIS